MNDSKPRIAFIGLGIMGSRMAANLMTAGYPLTVYNRTRSKADALLSQGAQWADSPAAAVADTPIVITMLAHPDAVESAALDETDGFLDAMQPGAIWMDCTTAKPAFARRMAKAAQARGLRFVEAPVAGSKQPAQDGNLIFIVGGDSETVTECQPLFDVMGRQTNHIGAHGMANALKLVNNHMLAVSMAAFAEALALGESLGLPRELLLNTLIGGAVTAPFVAGKREKIERGDYDADFPLQWMQKDLQMTAEAAFQTGTAMPVSNAAKELYQLASLHGFGEDDFSAVYAFLKGRA